MSQGEFADGITPLALIRHGETVWNRAGRVQGTTDSPLSALGRAQAKAVGAAIAASIDVLIASDLGRAHDTARAIAAEGQHDIALDPRLRERCYGVLEGHTWVEVEQKFPDAWLRMTARDPAYAPPSGESANAFRDRVMDALHDIARAHQGRRVAIVTHGGVVGVLYRHVMNIPLDSRREYSLLNASINRFRRVTERWFLDVWGDVSHLEGLAAADEI